jgi:hypothetical protein
LRRRAVEEFDHLQQQLPHVRAAAGRRISTHASHRGEGANLVSNRGVTETVVGAPSGEEQGLVLKALPRGTRVLCVFVVQLPDVQVVRLPMALRSEIAPLHKLPLPAERAIGQLIQKRLHAPATGLESRPRQEQD